jgi:hypothetical protein
MTSVTHTMLMLQPNKSHTFFTDMAEQNQNAGYNAARIQC